MVVEPHLEVGFQQWVDLMLIVGGHPSGGEEDYHVADRQPCEMV